MKRTGEIVLTVIGMILYVFFAVFGVMLILLQKNQDKMREILEDEALQNEGLTMADFNEAIDSIGSSSWVMAIFSVIAVILGIVVIVFLKGNKKPKPAGIILVVLAVLSVLLLGFGTWITALPYLSAGILVLSRKPKQPIAV